MKVEAKVSKKENSFFFNTDFNVYLAEPSDILFKFNSQSKFSPSDSHVRQSSKYLIDDILKMMPNCG